MNLHELHTPHPLRDADFAAIRARVRSQIARKPAWLAMFARFAFAAALVVVFVPITRERRPEVPVQVVRREIGPIGPIGPMGPIGPTRPIRPIRPTRPIRPNHTQLANRIEIITADPTIRIIWITPKESS